METLSGSIERITFYNPENGYSVIRLRPERAYRGAGLERDGTVTIVGNLPELTAGEHVKLQGRWGSHSKYGAQFQVEICEQTVPATVAGIRRYLGSGLIKGIGPKLAERIVQTFGAQTMDIIDGHPERLREVPDIGPVRSGIIAAAWEEQKQVKEIMLFLHSYGVSTNLTVKIYKQYGDKALAVVRTDPYRLARDIYGVGFKTADQIARSLGLPADHPGRIEAGVIYALTQATDEGQVYLPQPELAEQAAKILEVGLEEIRLALQRLEKEGAVMAEHLPRSAAGEGEGSEAAERPEGRGGEAGGEGSTTGIYLTPLYYSEKGTAGHLLELARALPTRLSDLPPAFTPLDRRLSQEQQAAIRMALGHPVSVLTGGPGTGKTTALKALIEALESGGKRFALASPTGRAAKRLSQATGRPASTIHRLLGYSPGEGFKYRADNPLPADFVVIDETSMLDLSLAHALLRAIQPGTHLLLVGDADQLPSVGAGNVLRDIIDSEAVPVSRLRVIFRQAAQSHIVTNAHRINRGQAPVFPERGAVGGDFFLFPAETAEEAAEWIEEIVCKRMPQRFGLHPRDEIQVLSPMYRGEAGVSALNERLQARLNPEGERKAEKRLFGQVFRMGDKVMQVVNNYDKEVYNGDIGAIFSINMVEQALVVDFEGRAVRYEWGEADELTLAYAVSVHKAQGSEYPAVVVPVLTQHYLMLQRNLLYTAVTRARRICVLVGSRRALWIAVRNDQTARRYSALDWRLRAGTGS